MEEFNVVALGPSLSGKTVFLASLYEAIQRPDALDGLTIGTSTTEGNRLRGVYDQMADPTTAWPPSQEPHEWHDVTFTCSVRSRYGSHEIFRIRYADYDGSHLARAERGSEVVARLEERIRNAHALLILIDGRSLLDYLEGRQSGRDFLRRDLQPMFDAINSCSGPIQYIITKWDLLVGRYNLRQIRDRLLSADDFPGFAALASSTSRQRFWEGRPLGPVRMIPVSATGDFAFLDDPAGGMRKDPTKRPTPYNIVIPLVAIIPDVCRWALDVWAAEEDDRGRAPSRPAGDYPSDGSGFRVGWFGVTIPVEVLAKVAVQFRRPVARAFRGVVRATRRQYRRRRVRELDKLRNAEAAMYYAINVLTRRLAEFEEANPDSRLDVAGVPASLPRIG